MQRRLAYALLMLPCSLAACGDDASNVTGSSGSTSDPSTGSTTADVTSAPTSDPTNSSEGSASTTVSTTSGESSGTADESSSGSGENCPAPLSDCDGACVDTSVDPDHCGGCGTPCATDLVCSRGICDLQCAGGTTECGRSCVDVDVDPGHCGGCDLACPAADNATVFCTGGDCAFTCEGVFDDCNAVPEDGCETDLDNDPLHCNACNQACDEVPNGTVGCSVGQCTIAACDAGFDDCDGVLENGCETNIVSDDANCGTCDLECGGNMNCILEECVAEPCTEQLNRIWGAADDDIWAVGNNGTILHYDGVDWTAINSGTAAAFLGVWGTATDDVWAVGSAVLSHWDGNAWTSDEPGGPQNVCTTRYDVWGGTPNHYQAGHCGGFFIRYDGNGWVTESVGGPQKTGIGGCSDTNVWGTDEALGWLTHWDGNQWTLEFLPDGIDQVGRYGVACVADDDVTIVGVAGNAIHYDGNTWQNEITGVAVTLREAADAGSGRVVAVGDAGTVVLRDAGNWQTIPSGTSVDLRGAWVNSQNLAWVVGETCSIEAVPLP